MRMIENLAIFDFDGTLFRAPDPPPWFTGRDWYTHPASLWPPCLPQKPDKKWWNEKVVHQARRFIQDRSTWCVLLTGRLETAVSVRWRIIDLLRLKNLKFDELHFNPGKYTPIFKKRQMTKLLRRYPQVTQVRIWEDQPFFLSDYIQFLNKTGKEIRPHRVRLSPSQIPDLLCSQEQFEIAYGGFLTTEPTRKVALVVFGSADPQLMAAQITRAANRIKGHVNRIIFTGENAADTWLFFQKEHPTLNKVYGNNIRVIPKVRDLSSGVRLSLPMIPPDYLTLVVADKKQADPAVRLYQAAGLSAKIL